MPQQWPPVLLLVLLYLACCSASQAARRHRSAGYTFADAFDDFGVGPAAVVEKRGSARFDYVWHVGSGEAVVRGMRWELQRQDVGQSWDIRLVYVPGCGRAGAAGVAGIARTPSFVLVISLGTM